MAQTFIAKSPQRQSHLVVGATCYFKAIREFLGHFFVSLTHFTNSFYLIHFSRLLTEHFAGFVSLLLLCVNVVYITGCFRSAS